jgi:hypothetical protein
MDLPFVNNANILPTHVKTHNTLWLPWIISIMIWQVIQYKCSSTEKGGSLWLCFREMSHTIYVTQVGCSICHPAKFEQKSLINIWFYDGEVLLMEQPEQ